MPCRAEAPMGDEKKSFLLEDDFFGVRSAGTGRFVNDCAMMTLIVPW
jgi:hypothetical protein